MPEYLSGRHTPGFLYCKYHNHPNRNQPRKLWYYSLPCHSFPVHTRQAVCSSAAAAPVRALEENSTHYSNIEHLYIPKLPQHKKQDQFYWCTDPRRLNCKYDPTLYGS